MNDDLCVVSTDKTLIDVDVVHSFLGSTYWATGIPRETVVASLANSLCLGAYLRDSGQMVGFARVVTDHATFAYLCDVFVLEDFRSRGIAKQLMFALDEHPVRRTVRRFMLATRDAHELYRAFGFKEVANPGALMEVLRTNMYVS